MFVKGIGYFIASIWLLQLAATNETPETDERIVGGQLTTIDHFPYVVQIRNKGQFYCGGSLLTPLLVVTAAHCVAGYNPDHLTVIGGATKLNESGVSCNVAKIMSFPNFDFDKKDNDVGALKLVRRLVGKNIDTIAMHTGEMKDGTPLQVIGWGLTSERGVSPSNQLRTATIRINNWEKCSKEYRGSTVTKNMFCASEPGTKDSCAGDSGGPAVIGKKLAGIVSFGMGCARKNYSGIYTNIQQVKDFIEKCLNS